jgi:chaperonin cofactor prefoldin
MEIIEDNLHPKVLKNKLFINAVDYLIEQGIVEDKKGVSSRTGITEAALSNIRNDKKIVSDKTIRKFLDGFPDIFNPAYFKGQNIYMTLKELMEAKMYADEQKRKEDDTPAPQAIDYTFLIEKAVEKATAYADKTIATLEKQVADKDKQIADLRSRVRELEMFINSQSLGNAIEKSPFPVGVAEDGSVHILVDKG